MATLHISYRALNAAEYIENTHATIRQTAAAMGGK